MIKINSQKELDIFLNIPKWEEAFIREWYLLSPSYIDSTYEVLVAPYSTPTMRILICFSDPTFPGLEILLEKVENINFSFKNELNPKGVYHRDIISLSLQGFDGANIIAESLYYQFLGKDCWGSQTKFGKDNYFDEGGFPFKNYE